MPPVAIMGRVIIMESVPLQNLGRLSDRIYSIVKEEILSGRLAPGQHLALEEIAQNLGVSTTPIRDALSQLAADGLVEWRPRRGAYVAHLTPKTISEIYQVRKILEYGAAELAIARGAAVADEMRSLAAQIAAIDTSADGQAAMDYAHLELRFHAVPIERIENSKLLEVYNSLSSVMIVAFTLYPADSRRRADVVAEHEAIVAALTAGDAVWARAAIYAHLENAQASLLARIHELQLCE